MQISQILAGLAVVLGLIVAWPTEAGGKCDFSGFDKPCAVQGGDYRALAPDGDGPFPAMIYLYGSGGKSATIANHPLFQAAVVQRGYALIVPAAKTMQYRANYADTGWHLRHEASAGPGRDDVLFVERVIDDAVRRFRLDRSRIVLVGQSRGAFLIWEIACHEPDMAAAYAVHAGGYLGKMPRSCLKPVRFLHSHGAADPIVPLAGLIASGGVTMAPVRASLDVLARTNDCGAEPADSGSVLGLARLSWTGCANGASLDLMLHQGGHGMPGEWFRAVLDWFEETPESRPEVKPRTVVAGSRTGELFKATPTGGSLLGGQTAPAQGQRLLPQAKSATE